MRKERVIALGFFDGVHLGHAALLRRTAEEAARRGCTPAVFTFDRPPKEVVTGVPCPLINSAGDRRGLVQRLYGIKDVILAPFDQEMMTTSWEAFVEELLVGRWNAVHLVAGHDYHFGYKGEGDPQRLQALCAGLGIGCDVIPKVELEGITVSSTHIRSLISKGDMAGAVRFLGHPHVLTATVQHGKRLGSRLGFPTANLAYPEGLLVPAHGVYVTRAVLENGESFPAVTNVGVRPTVRDGTALTAEPFILDFEGDLYGQQIRLEFYDFLRPERKFDSLEELRAMVLRNADQTRAFFAAHP